jgi:hypothetical protein
LVVCLDACFQQKRQSSPRDEWWGHPVSKFLSEEELAAMEADVNRLRPLRNEEKNSKQAYDRTEKGMKVPNSALDGCKESFTAADERRTGASTQFFSDTGIMGMVCSHDKVLWLANMTTAGKSQFYGLALIQRLGQKLPPTTHLGILYDIGCQVDRSCWKWEFLPKLAGRMTFGVSVFHAYGHQWACQIIYHPRKAKEFGLSDGEGCERLWSSLKLLISSLRVSGVSLLILHL